MKIEYDCGCIVEYRPCIARAHHMNTREWKPGSWGRPRHDAIKSSGETSGGGKGKQTVQFTWVVPCTLHNE